VIEVHGRRVTFTPPEGAAYLMGDFTDWDERPIRLDGPLDLEFPCGAYVEYAFMDGDGEPIADPDNPVRPRHPWYDYHRAVTLPGNGYRPPSEPQPIEGAVSEHVLDSPSHGRRQRYVVYEPPRAAESIMWVLDGAEYLSTLRFHQVADGLISAGRITPVRMVFLEPEDRRGDYWLSEAYEDFLLSEVLPHIERDRQPTGERAIWGASLGGLFACWTAWRHPDVFQKVGSQSGCFTAAPREGRPEASYYRDPEWLTECVSREPGRATRFYVDSGQIEWLLGPNRRFAAVLADRSYAHCYCEHPSGHNWTTWEQGLEAGLLHLFSNGCT
jgi:enterochelin esterase-like enzyme